MKIHRFYTEQQLSLGDNILTDEQLLRHLGVVRIKDNELIVLFNEDGFEYIATLKKQGKEYTATISDKKENECEPKKEVHLFLAILKNEHTEYALEKATELGIKSFTPLITERTIKTNINYERLTKIATHAAEQSGRAHVPVIHLACTLEEALSKQDKHTRILFCDIGEIHNTPSKQSTANQSCTVFVGPEGGWSDDERLLAREFDAEYISLGTTVLRGETAAIIGTYYALQK